MAIPFAKSVVCQVLIGRSSYLQTLHQSIDQAKNGYGQTVVISGEAGIGKSRLVAEATAVAIQQGFLILQGNCFQPDAAYPYAPLLDLLRPYLTVDRFEADTPHWASIIRELSRLLPELIPLSAPMEPASSLDPDQNKRRLFAALLQVFSYFAAQQPLLVVVEDLHWSDDTSLEFLHQLARWSKTQPSILLFTYRSDEMAPSLRHWLAQLDRSHLASELSLTRLTRTEVDEMLKSIFALRRPIRAEFLDTIHTLTDGNPFFIEEILKSLIAAGEIFYADDIWDRKTLSELHIPRSVQDAVQQRVSQLSDNAKQIVVTAAVTGRRFDFALLQALTQHDEPELLRGIKELIGAQLVVEESSERFAFRHALTRQAIYAALLIRERAVLHQSIAETIEHLHADSLDAYGAELAYHFYEAGRWERTLHYSWRAGERARQLYALQSAINHYSHALEAAQQLAVPPPLPLLRARGLVYEVQGDFERARLDHELVLQLAQVNSDLQLEWQALLDLGMLWAGRDYSKTGAYYQQALQLARGVDDPSLIAHSLNRLGNWHVNAEQPVEGQQCHQEALTIFQRLNDTSELAQTLDLWGVASYGSGDLIQGAKYLEQAASLFRDLADRPSLASSLTMLMLCKHENYETITMVPDVTTLAVTEYEGELALQIAREIGWSSREAFALIQMGMCLGLQGDYGRAFEMAENGLSIAEGIEHQQWITGAYRVLGVLHSDLLNFPLAQRHLERALTLAREIGSSIWESIIGCIQIWGRVLGSIPELVESVT